MKFACMLELDGHKGYVGTLRHKTEDRCQVTCSFNLGRLGLPTFSIAFAILKGKADLDWGNEGSFWRFMYTWEPGSKIPGKDDSYQIMDFGLERLTQLSDVFPIADDEHHPIQEWVVEDSMDDKIMEDGEVQDKGQNEDIGFGDLDEIWADADHRDWQRLLLFRATLANGRFHGPPVVQKQTLFHGLDKRSRLYKFIWAIGKAEAIKISTWMLMPSTQDPERWVTNFSKKVEATWTRRHLPLGQYRKNCGIGEIDLHDDIESAQTFGNHMYTIYNNDQIADIAKIIEGDRNVRWPVAETFSSVPRMLYFSNIETFLTLHWVGLIRGFQLREQQRLAMTQDPVRIFMMKSMRLAPEPPKSTMTHKQTIQSWLNRSNTAIERADRMPLGAQEIKQMGLTYGYVFLNKRAGTRTLKLELGTQVYIDFIAHDKERNVIHHQQSEKWMGFVKEISQREQQLTGADCLVVLKRQREARLVDLHTDFSQQPPRNELPLAMLSANPDTKSHIRTVEGLKAFCDTKRTDLDALRSTIVYTPELTVKEVDITFGVPPSPLKAQWFKAAVDELKKLDGTYPRQFEVMMNCRNVQNNLMYVLGGAGCQKTWTFAWLSVLLSAIGHKFHVSTEDNKTVGHFLNTCVRAIAKAQDMKFSFAEKLQRLNIFRFVPLPRELRQVKCSQSVGQDGMFIYSSKQDDQWLKDERAAAMLLAWHEDLERSKQNLSKLTRAEVEAVNAKGAQINRTFESLRRDYELLAQEEALIEAFWTTTLPFHIDRLIEEDQTRGTNHTAEYQRLATVVRDAEHDFHDEGRLLEELEKLLVRVMGSCHIFGSTYNAAADELVIEVSKATICIHAECSKTRLAAASALLSKKGVQCHMVIGDRHQLGPYEQGSQFNETSASTDLSIADVLISKNVTSTFLDTQSRMHQDISKWPCHFFYEDRLKNASCVRYQSHIRTAVQQVMWARYGTQSITRSNYYFVDAPKGVATRQEGDYSLQNFANASIAVDIICDLVKAGVPSREIGFLSFYSKQVELVRKMLTKILISMKVSANDITMATVDVFQGRDKAVIVGENPTTAHDLKFLQQRSSLIQPVGHMTAFASKESRYRVMATRARDGFIFIANAMTMVSAKGRMKSDKSLQAVQDMVRDAMQRKVFIIDDRRDPNPLFEDGMTAAAQNELVELQKKQQNLGWMQDVMAAGRSRTAAHEKTSMPAYQGPKFGTRHEVFPSEIIQDVQRRELTQNAKPRKAETGEEKPKKPRATGRGGGSVRGKRKAVRNQGIN